MQIECLGGDEDGLGRDGALWLVAKGGDENGLDLLAEVCRHDARAVQDVVHDGARVNVLAVEQRNRVMQVQLVVCHGGFKNIADDNLFGGLRVKSEVFNTQTTIYLAG